MDATEVTEAARRSPLRTGPRLSELADRDELRFRDETEPIDEPLRLIPGWIDGKELPRLLKESLRLARLRPRGTVVELGAGACWLGAVLARDPAVERVISIEFSRRRIEDFAPIAIAHLGAPPEKIERVIADFYAHGLDDGIAEMVFTDAAFHHAVDPQRLADVAFRLLKPDGVFVLHREPTLSLIRRTRPHELEDQHGSFEREYDWWTYLRFLRCAGFEAYKAPAPVGFRTRLERARVKPPLGWLNGITFSTFTYVGVKPAP